MPSNSYPFDFIHMEGSVNSIGDSSEMKETNQMNALKIFVFGLIEDQNEVLHYMAIRYK